MRFNTLAYTLVEAVESAASPDLSAVFQIFKPKYTLVVMSFK